MSSFHPFFVHFPIALLSISFLFEIVFLLRGEIEFSRVGWWLHMAGTLGILLSVATGLRAVSGTQISPEVLDVLSSHQGIALVVTALFSGLLLWRVGRRTALPEAGRAIYMAAFAAGVILMWLGAWYGGQLVYHFGLGVATP
jgi:uncharacterized membrane protein